MGRGRGLVLLALTVFGAACAGGPPPPGAGGDYLENATWHLRSVDALRVQASEDAPWLRVTSTDGRVQGSTGCNTFTGPYRAGGTEVAFGPLAVTRRACGDPARAELERVFLEVLQSADGYRVGSGRLDLMVGGRIRALLEAGPSR